MASRVWSQVSSTSPGMPRDEKVRFRARLAPAAKLGFEITEGLATGRVGCAVAASTELGLEIAE
jgi:hypothetical protein